jgi:hypothetical protein
MENRAFKVIEEVNKIIEDKKIFEIFPNSSLEIIKPALIDAFMLGFSLDSFARKDIYILDGTLNNKYNLVVSIDYYRKTAMAWGLIKISDPLYEYNDKKELISCSIRITRKVKGEQIEISSRVMLYDYDKGTGLWVSKPFVMLAKVCEASAYRKAFPELFSKVYIEEEFEKEIIAYEDKLSKAGSLAELRHIWSKLPPIAKKNEELINIKNNLKKKYDYR